MKLSKLRDVLPLALLIAASTAGHADPSDPNKWSKVVVAPPLSWVISNVDTTTKTSVGTLWIRPVSASGTKGTPTAIRIKGDNAVLAPGNYEFYFDTTWKAFGMHLQVSGPNNKPKIGLHVTNLDPLVSGTEIQVSGDPVNGCPIIVDPTGYRNSMGGTLFTIGTEMDVAGKVPEERPDPDHFK